MNERYYNLYSIWEDFEDELEAWNIHEDDVDFNIAVISNKRRIEKGFIKVIAKETLNYHDEEE